MLTYIIVGITCLIIGYLFSKYNCPFGYQDEKGFHLDEPVDKNSK